MMILPSSFFHIGVPNQSCVPDIIIGHRASAKLIGSFLFFLPEIGIRTGILETRSVTFNSYEIPSW